MDPNATLAEFRALVAIWQAAGSRGPWSEEAADRVIELAADLDRWMSKGGFPPDAWALPARSGRRA